jgi:hypothetical protein
MGINNREGAHHEAEALSGLTGLLAGRRSIVIRHQSCFQDGVRFGDKARLDDAMVGPVRPMTMIEQRR